MQIKKWFNSIVFRNTIYSLIEMAIPAILMLVSTRFLLSGMGVIDYGLWNLGLAFLGLIGIADIGIGAATIKFVAESFENHDIQSLSEIITTSFVISVALGAFFTVLLYLLSPWFASFFGDVNNRGSDILVIFQICIFGLLPVILENIGLAVPRGLQEYKTTTILLVIQNILTIFFAIWVVTINGTTIEIIAGTVIITWCFAIISLVFAFYRVNKIGVTIIFSIKALSKLTGFMLFMGITGIGIKIFTLFDRVVVAQTLGLEASAYYSIATGIANKFTALGSAATQALFPAFSSWNVNNGKEVIWRRLVTSTLFIGIGAIVPGMILLSFSQPLVFWWLGKENGSAILIPMQILIFIYMVKTITAPSYQAANGLGFPWITSLATMIASLGTIGLIIVLGNIYGLNGAACANIASWSLFVITFFLYKVLKNQKSPNKTRGTDVRTNGHSNKTSETSISQPLVSIIIPSFNQGRFIGETIDSILLQNYRPIEIIVIDARSVDQTINILHKYDDIPEVHWISETDNGHADGINKGFAKANGEILGWLNADDVYYSGDVIQTAVEVFNRQPQLDVLYGDVAIISTDSTLLRLFFLPPYSKERILRQNFICQPAVFMHKLVTEHEKLNIEQIGLDYEYWLRLVTKGYQFFHINKILACDRHYPGRISVTYRTVIDSQIANVKSKMGLSQTKFNIMYLIDRLFQAVCRIKGLVFLVFMPFTDKKQNIVFHVRIDSYPRLLMRQLTKAIGSDFKV